MMELIALKIFALLLDVSTSTMTNVVTTNWTAQLILAPYLVATLKYMTVYVTMVSLVLSILAAVKLVVNTKQSMISVMMELAVLLILVTLNGIVNTNMMMKTALMMLHVPLKLALVKVVKSTLTMTGALMPLDVLWILVTPKRDVSMLPLMNGVTMVLNALLNTATLNWVVSTITANAHGTLSPKMPLYASTACLLVLESTNCSIP
jgi:hypothetical protein